MKNGGIVKGKLKAKKTTILVYLLLLIFIFIFLGCIMFPTVFYDNFIWKHYWGPVVADAMDDTVTYNGVTATEGYTYESEITYGILIIIALYFIYKLLKKLKITVDWRFALSLMPYIVYGPVSRVLEDANYFSEPVVYWFISPFIYAQIAFFAILFLIIGWYFKENKDKIKGFYYSIITILFVNIFITIIWSFGAKNNLEYFEPILFYLVSCIGLLPLIYVFNKKKEISVSSVVFSGGLFLLFPSLYLTGKWIFIDQWSNTAGVRFDAFLLIIFLVCLIVGLVYLIAHLNRKNENIVVYKNPLNLAMLFGHLLDGITSYVSIQDPLGMGGLNYSEKHPLSGGLLDIWGPLFPIVKFILIILVIYVFDILYKDELKKYQRLVNLLKIGIIILGFSPGLRDLLRVTMGV